MPVILEANYSKKIGLPGYSSHQYSITLRTEISDLTQVSAESQRLYGLLQGCVDRDIQATGFLPKNGEAQHSNGNGRAHKNGSGDWCCSDKQRDLILKIIDDNLLDKQEVENLAVERFGKGVKLLNKLEASGLIEELLQDHPQQQQRAPARRNGNGNGRYHNSRA